ncbi:MAG TPA: flagellar biosynthesis regulator FlaF [Acetobacteraceae bacterium]|jgi:flagellar biosynthesis regulator FlaF|nr:flagellar biosynthesis regulator FlaF [Acetobacteraceae bacterium]
MQNGMIQAARAYAASSAHRSLRAQEAEVFRHANAALRHGQQNGTLARVRALADNARLWTAVIDLMRDPANALPEPLRASIVSVGLAVQREMQGAAPDFDFLIGVNDDIAAGLAQQG